MKKIAVITFHNSNNNYGAVLQCFALQHFLKSKGYDPYVIKYIHSTWNKSNFKKLLNCRLVFGFIKNKLSSYSGKKRQINYDYKRDFDGFRKQYIKYSDLLYQSIDDLRENPPQADVYICGSDQIWNAPNNYLSPIYFLDFGSEMVKRIAYAASFGKDRPNKSTKKTFSNYLSRFKAVYLREYDGCQLCINAGRYDAKVVVDPTLLLQKEEYLKMIGNHTLQHEKYAFAYILNIKSEDDVNFNSFYEYVSSLRLDIKKVMANECDVLKKFPNQYYTIPEWIAAIFYSSVYITTSFHGVVFAIILEKPFLVYLLSGDFKYGNERIFTLLHQLGLEERIYNQKKDFKLQMESKIDWVGVKIKLEILRMESIKLLISAIEN